MNDILLEAIKYEANTTAIKDKLLPKVEEAMSNSSVRSNYKRCVNDFISVRAQRLYDTVPCDRIPCFETEMDKLFDVLKIKKKDVKEIIDETYYGLITNFNPLAAKHEFTVTQLLVIRYYLMAKNDKDCELACLHLAFSGKFYPSLHYKQYPYPPARYIMEYVVSNELSKKFLLVVYGNAIGAVRAICRTWLETYKDRFVSLTDEDVVYLIEQLHSRIGSFVINVATEYYKAHDDPEKFMAYTSDSYEEDDYHLADGDSLRIAKCTEKAINYINANGAQYKICNMCSDSNITPNECRAVVESIISNKQNVLEMKELVSLMISLYFQTGKQDLTDLSFITFSIAPKPNAKQKEIIRMKEIVENWLSESGTAYIRRRSRVATKNSYERCVRMYFAIVINYANK